MPLAVYVQPPVQQAGDLAGKPRHSMQPPAHFVTDDFCTQRRIALSGVQKEFETPANQPLKGADGDGDCKKQLHLETSAAIGNLADLDEELLSGPNTPDSAKEVRDKIFGWRLLRHEESFPVPLDDHVSASACNAAKNDLAYQRFTPQLHFPECGSPKQCDAGPSVQRDCPPAHCRVGI